MGHIWVYLRDSSMHFWSSITTTHILRTCLILESQWWITPLGFTCTPWTKLTSFWSRREKQKVYQREELQRLASRKMGCLTSWTTASVFPSLCAFLQLSTWKWMIISTFEDNMEGCQLVPTSNQPSLDSSLGCYKFQSMHFSERPSTSLPC